MKKNTFSVRRLTASAMLLAAGLLLPFLTGQIQGLGRMLAPLHLPVYICGMICGPFWGLLLGVILPVLRSALFGMPPMFPVAVTMAFELAAYGFIAGLLREKLPKTLPMLFVSLIVSMLLGRVVWGLASLILLGFTPNSFTWQAFITGGFINAVPGLILQLIVVPPVVRAVEKSKLVE